MKKQRAFLAVYLILHLCISSGAEIRNQDKFSTQALALRGSFEGRRALLRLFGATGGLALIETVFHQSASAQDLPISRGSEARHQDEPEKRPDIPSNLDAAIDKVMKDDQEIERLWLALPETASAKDLEDRNKLSDVIRSLHPDTLRDFAEWRAVLEDFFAVARQSKTLRLSTDANRVFRIQNKSANTSSNWDFGYEDFTLLSQFLSSPEYDRIDSFSGGHKLLGLVLDFFFRGGITINPKSDIDLTMAGLFTHVVETSKAKLLIMEHEDEHFLDAEKAWFDYARHLVKMRHTANQIQRLARRIAFAEANSGFAAEQRNNLDAWKIKLEELKGLWPGLVHEQGSLHRLLIRHGAPSEENSLNLQLQLQIPLLNATFAEVYRTWLLDHNLVEGRSAFPTPQEFGQAFLDQLTFKNKDTPELRTRLMNGADPFDPKIQELLWSKLMPVEAERDTVMRSIDEQADHLYVPGTADYNDLLRLPSREASLAVTPAEGRLNFERRRLLWSRHRLDMERKNQRSISITLQGRPLALNPILLIPGITWTQKNQEVNIAFTQSAIDIRLTNIERERAKILAARRDDFLGSRSQWNAALQTMSNKADLMAKSWTTATGELSTDPAANPNYFPSIDKALEAQEAWELAAIDVAQARHHTDYVQTGRETESKKLADRVSLMLNAVYQRALKIQNDMPASSTSRKKESLRDHLPGGFLRGGKKKTSPEPFNKSA